MPEVLGVGTLVLGSTELTGQPLKALGTSRVPVGAGSPFLAPGVAPLAPEGSGTGSTSLSRTAAGAVVGWVDGAVAGDWARTTALTTIDMNNAVTIAVHQGLPQHHRNNERLILHLH